MSGGSDASILGYGNITPFSNVNNSFVNVTSTNNPSNFTSNIIPGTPPGPLPGLAGAKGNIDAASSCVSGACYKGGGMKTPFYRNLKKKIKNITRKYRMRKVRKTKLRKRTSKRKSHTKKRRHYRGGMSAPSYPAGYGQYQNNLPSTPSYSVGGILSGNAELGLANPPPITRMTNSDVDNYNHFTGKTFESRGH
jgi:hypothetical protein